MGRVEKFVGVIHLDHEGFELFRQVCEAWRGLPKYKIFVLAWPRCPVCGAPLSQKFASNNLICTKCGREFKLVEAVKTS